MLASKNVKVLGGEVESLLETNKQETLIEKSL